MNGGSERKQVKSRVSRIDEECLTKEVLLLRSAHPFDEAKFEMFLKLWGTDLPLDQGGFLKCKSENQESRPNQLRAEWGEKDST